MAVEVRTGPLGLELAVAGEPRGVSIDIDEIRRRVKQGRRLALARACGVVPSAVAGASVLDAMAGLGVDGVTLACLGAHVTLVEREPSTFAVLVDGVDRARVVLAPPGALECIHGDAEDVMRSGKRFDVVYLDPMFPERSKRALPRLRAQVLGAAGTPDSDHARVLDLARGVARSRVVVKRRSKDPCVAKPDWSIRARSVRFDVYAAASTDPSRSGVGAVT